MSTSLPSSFFATNRTSLLREIGEGSLLVITGYREMQRGYDAAHPFEQEANFWYLTGIDTPDWWLVCDGLKKTYLVAPELSHTKEIFDGSLSVDEALRISGVDEVIDRDGADSLLIRLARARSMVYSVNESARLKPYVSFALNPAQNELDSYLKNRFKDVRNCGRELANLRAIKRPEEISLLQKSIDLTVEAFMGLRAKLPELTHEYQIEAHFNYAFRATGGRGHAYSPIAAAHGNACTLHYVDNQDELINPSLTLLDIGAKYDHYAADISRTYGIGEVTERQRNVFEAVRDVQRRCIELYRPGQSIAALQDAAETFTFQALESLGLSHDKEDLHIYFPHALGHGLGIDVHDSLGSYETLRPGMVLTAEPGIYIPSESIGVRIEDDILITDNGPVNLSAALSTDL